MGQYKRLAAIVETTRSRRRPLRLEVRGGRDSGLWLAVTRANPDETLATAPFDPDDPDTAAEDVARRLTLDGDLPRGMDL